MTKQETDYSCGAFAVKTIVKHLLNKDVTEKHCRVICKTKHGIGTDSKGLIKAFSHWNLNYTEHKIFNKITFTEKFKNAMQSERVVILSVHDLYHWISILEMYGKKFLVVDSDFSKPKQWLTLRQVTSMANQYDKINDKSYFNFFEIWRD